jgi:pimeloyl-ACP methyl ester carboxylesterase
MSKSDSSTIITKDRTEIYYKDWGKGPVVTFSHGWPLSSDAWDGQMLYLVQKGFRVVAHDRRGLLREERTVITIILDPSSTWITLSPHHGSDANGGGLALEGGCRLR